MTELKIIDEQTIELDGRFYDLRNPEPKVERNIYEDVYLEEPKIRNIYFHLTDDCTWYWLGNSNSNSHFTLSLVTKNKEARAYLVNRQKLLIRLQRACLRAEGVIKRTDGYDVQISIIVDRLEASHSTVFGGFAFKTHGEQKSFISSNESDLKEFFNVK